MTTIAITGSTGQLGQLALAAIKARGGQAIALARDPSKVSGEARAFDYTKPETFGALKGVDVLVLISSNDFNDRVGQHKAVIAAAKAHGVGHVIYTSILKGDASPMILAQDHIGTEAALKASGLGFTLLRNGWYIENYTGALGAAIQHGAMIGSAGKGRISGAARADYAEAIAAVALDASKQGQVYELAGDVAFTMAEMAAVVSAKAGKPVAYVSMPPADYAKALEGFGLPAGFAAILADSDDHSSRGALFDESKTLSGLIGRPTTPMAEVVAAALA
ncbi:SDR family oxidoreductase [Stagnihabitans tardus]|uniref:NmrA family NAD(P)-binding protein n=1 Tax=Stagnihabitans tardus TaxID=2699202 RepID=A0AAE4YAD7_9RHOB|nr:SDR family oxidoreductase [Stagnihabitans tardus]NBZ87668.1 NmrA family NAD(P)-binding protein [Stagnihabitans tardus]